MKKLCAAMLAAVMFAAVASGCFGAGQKAAVATGDEAASQNASDYENNFEGLCNYLASFGYINPVDENADVTFTVMDASLIGAAKGRRFTEQTMKKANIEIYEYSDTKNATADEVLKSVKDNGTFSILELPEVNALLSDNGKYLMVYKDQTIDESKTDADNYKLREEIIEKFKEFHK